MGVIPNWIMTRLKGISGAIGCLVTILKPFIILTLSQSMQS